METASNITISEVDTFAQREAEFSELISVLRQIQPFVYFPSSGNGGDALIAHATFAFFQRHCLSYELYEPRHAEGDRAIVIGGGGGFVDGYRKMSQLVELLSAHAAPVVVLPSSCLGYERELGMMDERFHFFARESVTAAHVSKHVSGAKVSLCHDMAISLAREAVPEMRELPWLLRGQPWDYQLKWFFKRPKIVDLLSRNQSATLMLRVDIEAARGRGEVPRENYDISHLVKGKMDREDRAEAIARVFCGVISRQQRIVTDRLHVSIGSGLLGIPCEMRANSYHKNRSIYEESIKKFFPWVAFSG